MKTCTICGIQKPTTEYHKHKRGAMGVHAWCKPCANERRRQRKATPEQRTKWDLQTRYGLSVEQWNVMLASQKGVCAICHGKMSRPVVDHNHSTGDVRAILCHPCNIKLHAVEDSVFLQKALAYLEAHNK